MSKMAKSPFRNLCSVIQKHFYSTSSLPKSTSRVNSVGRSAGSSSESVVSISNEILVEQKTRAALNFLKSHGFSEAESAELMRKWPGILRSRISTVLKPKIEFLVKNGFSGSLLSEMVLMNPTILRRGLNGHLKPSMQLLKKVLGTNEKVKAVVMRSSRILTDDLKKTVQPNVELMTAEGVPLEEISRMMVWQPRAILKRVERMACCINKVKKLGLQPDNPMFIHTLRVVLSMSEATWNNKLQAFKSLGWTEEQVMNAFKRQPVVLGLSEKKIRSTTNFLVKHMKLTPDAIIAYPKYLLYGVDSRLSPRYNVINVLKARKLLKKDLSFQSVLGLNMKNFYSKYVLKYLDKVPELKQIYSGPEVKL